MALEKKTHGSSSAPYHAVQIFKPGSAADDLYIYFGDGDLIETETIANEIADFIIKRLQSDKPLVVMTQDEFNDEKNDFHIDHNEGWR